MTQDSHATPNETPLPPELVTDFDSPQIDSLLTAIEGLVAAVTSLAEHQTALAELLVTHRAFTRDELDAAIARAQAGGK